MTVHNLYENPLFNTIKRRLIDDILNRKIGYKCFDERRYAHYVGYINDFRGDLDDFEDLIIDLFESNIIQKNTVDHIISTLNRLC